jgi:hypothetical protein
LSFGLLGLSLLIGLAVGPASAAPPTPQSATHCSGSLRRSPASGAPNQLGYRFHCDTPITAYTVLVNRRPTNVDNIDAFRTDAVVEQPNGSVVSTESFTCEGDLPGTGFNCNAGAGGSMSAGNAAVGTFDPTAPYCKSIPPKAKRGTHVTPTALVQVVVTDSTGAEDGPFRLGPRRRCPRAAVKVAATHKR